MSSTTELIPFQQGHLLLIDAPVTNHDQRQIVLQTQHGPTWTLLVNRRVAAIGGVAQIAPGIGEAWALVSEQARRHPVALTRAAYWVIVSTLQSLPLRRVQCHVKTLDKRAVRWAECLEFVREGTLAAYGSDGSDHDIMAITR